jgi:hypothetical protein
LGLRQYQRRTASGLRTSLTIIAHVLPDVLDGIELG